MRNRGKVTKWVGAVAVGALALTACGGSSKAASGGNGGSKSPFTIGATGSFTGSVGAASLSYLNGMRIAINAANGAGGVDGRKINIKLYDDGGDASQGVANTRTAITVDHVIGICCGVFSAVTEASDPLWEQYKVPGISEGAPPGTLTAPGATKGNPYEFVSDLNAGDGEWQQEIAVVGKLAQQEHIASPKIALAALATATGVAWSKSFTTAAKAKGWTVTTSQQVSLTGTDLTPPAAQIANTKPDFVVGTVASTSEQPFFQQLRQDGFKGPIIDYSSGVVLSIFQALNDPNLYGLLAWNYPGGNNQAVQTYLSEAKQQKINPSLQLTPSGYAAGLMLVAALKKCGANCNSAGLQKSLSGLGNFDAGGFFAGPMDMSATNHDAVQTANLVHFVNGKLQVAMTLKGSSS